MNIKSTDLLASELEVISDSQRSIYCKEVLREAAQRLIELERIAEFYHKEASRLVRVHRRKEICKNIYRKK